MNQINEILNWLASGLMVPVIILLILLFLSSLLLVGAFFGQYLKHSKTAATAKAAVAGITKDNVDTISERLPRKSKELVFIYMRKVLEEKENLPEVQHLLTEFEIRADKDLGYSKMLAKLGPMLGLMGTLIPMGPALAGLSSGNIEQMSSNMQVAFATTVIGLFSAAVGFVTQQIKQRWYLADMSNLEFVAELLKENQK